MVLTTAVLGSGLATAANASPNAALPSPVATEPECSIATTDPGVNQPRGDMPRVDYSGVIATLNREIRSSIVMDAQWA